MKKILRKIFCIITVLCLVFALSGCTVLNEAKAAQAFWSEDGAIILGDSQYMLLPSCDDLQPVYSDYDKSIYVTVSDVPVLLSAFLGMECYQSDDGIFLDLEGETYCRADRYKDISSRIENGITFDNFCYYYFGYNENTDEWQNFHYLLTEEQSYAIETVYNSVSPTELPDGAGMNYDHSLTLEACTKDMLFRSYACDLCNVNDTYYLSISVAEYNTTVLYQVPAEMNDIFEDIMADYIDSEQYWGY